MTQQQFLELLFEPTENTCFAHSPYETKLAPIGYTHPQQYFSINPMHTSRADKNVTVFRNFLVEFDTLPAGEQMLQMKKVPYTTCVWSGGKSFHFIISLKEPCADRAEYASIMQRILDKLPDADRTARNPSRLSRLGGSLRDNGASQPIIYLRSRISRDTLEAWLGPAKSAPPKEKPDHRKVSDKVKWHPNPYTLWFLHNGAPEGSWNKNLFMAAIDLIRCNYTADEVYDKLEAVTGKLDKNDRRTIASAIRSANNDV